MVLYEFKDFYNDCYNIENYDPLDTNRLNTVIYKGSSPTIVITHKFFEINHTINGEKIDEYKLFYYVYNKTGSVTLKNMFDAINAQTDEYKKIYDTQNVKRLYIEEFIPHNPITFKMLCFAFEDDNEDDYIDTTDTDGEYEY